MYATVSWDHKIKLNSTRLKVKIQLYIHSFISIQPLGRLYIYIADDGNR